MPKVRPLEINALIPLVERDWETPEALVQALILALDEVRASRTSYVGVLQVGGPRGIYLGVGPYSGAKSAARALAKHPAMADKTLMTGAVVVPIYSAEGFAQHLKEWDEPAKVS